MRCNVDECPKEATRSITFELSSMQLPVMIYPGTSTRLFSRSYCDEHGYEYFWMNGTD